MDFAGTLDLDWFSIALSNLPKATIFWFLDRMLNFQKTFFWDEIFFEIQISLKFIWDFLWDICMRNFFFQPKTIQIQRKTKTETLSFAMKVYVALECIVCQCISVLNCKFKKKPILILDQLFRTQKVVVLS